MSPLRTPTLLLALAGMGFAQIGFAQINIQLSKETEQAYDDYVKAAEAKMDWKARFAVGPAENSKAGTREFAGKTDKNLIIAAGGAEASSLSSIEIKDGLIHDWAAGIFVPGGTVDKSLAVLQDYEGYKKLYAPQVSESKLLEHKGNKFRVYLKLNKSKGLISAVLDSEYEVEYKPLGANRWSKLSRSTKMNEIQFGKVQPVGTGVGFLWRMNAYWVIEPRPGGVYLECRSISLSRDIPPGLGWMIKPMVTNLPRESLRDTMTATAGAMGRAAK